MKKSRITIVGILILICTLLGGCANKNTEQEASVNTETPVVENASEVEEEEQEKAQKETQEEAEEEQEEAQEETQEEAQEETREEVQEAELPDGIYLADFDTDNSMFRVSEACDGKGTLTVENGEMTIHVSLGSKNIVNLYCGLAEDAKKDGAELLSPTIDSVTYSDGWTEEVYGFDIPVKALDEEFDLALIGTKGKWYDHKVIVSNPEPLGENKELEDGSYTIEITFEGGSGKAEILSPVTITVEGESVTATVQWNSPNYDYMLVDGEKYLPINTEGDSVFEIPVSAFDKQINVIGDTVAMSKPHEVEYTLTFHSDTIKAVE